MRFHSWPLAIGVLLLLSGCNDPKSPRGFSLPEGDIERGQATFEELQCTACHSVASLDLQRPQGAELNIRLGGEVDRVRTYGQLVTSIINPSHRLAVGYDRDLVSVNGESVMRNYNDTMTVSQLIDLVAFLESRYEIVDYYPTSYPMHP